MVALALFYLLVSTIKNVSEYESWLQIAIKLVWTSDLTKHHGKHLIPLETEYIMPYFFNYQFGNQYQSPL